MLLCLSYEKRTAFTANSWKDWNYICKHNDFSLFRNWPWIVTIAYNLGAVVQTTSYSMFKMKSSMGRSSCQMVEEDIKEYGITVLKSKQEGHSIWMISIIGEVEGHETAQERVKTTKYEHLLPILRPLGSFTFRTCAFSRAQSSRYFTPSSMQRRLILR